MQPAVVPVMHATCRRPHTFMFEFKTGRAALRGMFDASFAMHVGRAQSSGFIRSDRGSRAQLRPRLTTPRVSTGPGGVPAPRPTPTMGTFRKATALWSCCKVQPSMELTASSSERESYSLSLPNSGIFR